MKFLSDNQLSHFEVQSIKDDAWSQIKTELYILFKQNDNFRILDIGGGTGKFVDKILNEFPNSQAVIIDSSELLLSKNTEHPRKSTIMNSVENLAKVFENEKFDFISLNCVLHHFVDDSYTESTNNIANVLRTAKKLINAKGAILVHEIPYNGLVIDELPSKFIFGLTNIKSKLIVKILRAAGANTAGVGVCFLSERKFESIFENVRLNLYKKYNVPHVPLSLLYRFALHVKQTTYTDFWLRA